MNDGLSEVSGNNLLAGLGAEDAEKVLNRSIVYEAAMEKDPRAKMKRLSHLAAQKLAHKMTCGNDKVELMASKDILDRSGFKEPEKSEHKIVIEFRGGREWFDGGDKPGEIIDVTPERKGFLL